VSQVQSGLRIADTARRVVEQIERVIVGKADAIELTMVAGLVGGHVLIEDVPGIGKTTLAKTFARAIGGTFGRVQCTPDLLPSDVTGTHVFDQQRNAFTFQPGPVFANVLLVDELNRATPRTQAALLEAMEERQVTLEGSTYALPEPFIVLATQNPIEYEGTFPLPEAQLDRFLIRLRLGYPTEQEEELLISRFEGRGPLEGVTPATNPAGMNELCGQLGRVRVDAAIRRYGLAVVRGTRVHHAVRLGASPRASIALDHASRALAAIRGRDYVLPDDIKELAKPVLAHRLVLHSQSRLRGKSDLSVIDDVLEGTAVPIE
jgi:MoxR-like ATPase